MSDHLIKANLDYLPRKEAIWIVSKRSVGLSGNWNRYMTDFIKYCKNTEDLRWNLRIDCWSNGC